ncbi:polysaccharide deacetylase family protein [Flavitalea antarctica]
MLQSAGPKVQSQGEIVQTRDAIEDSQGANVQTRDAIVDSHGSILQSNGVMAQHRKVIVQSPRGFVQSHGAIVRGDTNSKKMAIVFTGDEFADGGEHIISTLVAHHVKASFFLTGNFYANPAFRKMIMELKAGDHYLGAHSDKHLLYCDWTRRDSLLVTEELFHDDLSENYKKMETFGIVKNAAKFFLPPFEWYNDTISLWTKKDSLQLINYSPGTRTTADYTTPLMNGYRTSDEIFRSVVDYEAASSIGLNGFIMLIHIGTDPARKDKFYHYLDKVLQFLKAKGYTPVKIDELLAGTHLPKR